MCAIGWVGVACVARDKKDSERNQNRKVDGEEEKKKKERSGKKRGWDKKKVFWKIWCSGDSTHEHNQEGSQGRPLSHKYLRKGPT